MIGFAFLISAWSVYFFLHSFLAGESVKAYVAKIAVRKFKYYRLAYATFSGIGLILLFLLNGVTPSSWIFESTGVVGYVSLALAAWGIIVIRLAFREYKLSSFLGFSSEPSEFKRNGILKRVRHPIYTGTILLVLGFLLYHPKVATLISSGCIFIYLAIGICLEEKKLIKAFGDSYRAYKREVPILFPRMRIW